MTPLLHTAVVRLTLAFQGGGESPFASAPLPFEELKSPPDRAFEVVLAAGILFLLAGLAAAAFLALSKLGSLERAVSTEHARLRDELAALRAQLEELQAQPDDASVPPDGPSIEAAVDRIVARLDAHGDQLQRALQESRQGSGDASAGGPGTELAARLDGLVKALDRRASVALDAGELAAAIAPGLERGIERGFAGAVAGAAQPAMDDEDDSGPADLDAEVRSRLIALGYESPAIVTALEELGAPSHASGSLVVEARRAGVVHKGRVVVQDGAVTVVQMQPGHRAFP